MYAEMWKGVRQRTSLAIRIKKSVRTTTRQNTVSGKNGIPTENIVYCCIPTEDHAMVIDDVRIPLLGIPW